jgi:hypothetical protein
MERMRDSENLYSTYITVCNARFSPTESLNGGSAVFAAS